MLMLSLLGGGVETGNAAFLFGFQIGTQKEES